MYVYVNAYIFQNTNHHPSFLFIIHSVLQFKHSSLIPVDQFHFLGFRDCRKQILPSSVLNMSEHFFYFQPCKQRTFSTSCASHLTLLKVASPSCCSNVSVCCRSVCARMCEGNTTITLSCSFQRTEERNKVWCMKQMDDFNKKSHLCLAWCWCTKLNLNKKFKDNWYYELSYCFHHWSAGGWGLLSSPWCWSCCSLDSKTLK